MGLSCCAGDEFPPTNVAPTSVFIHLHRKPAGGRAFYSSCTTWGRAQRLSCTEHTTFCTLTHEALLMQGVEGCRAAAPPPPPSAPVGTSCFLTEMNGDFCTAPAPRSGWSPRLGAGLWLLCKIPTPPPRLGIIGNFWLLSLPFHGFVFCFGLTAPFLCTPRGCALPGAERGSRAAGPAATRETSRERASLWGRVKRRGGSKACPEPSPERRSAGKAQPQEEI